MSNTVQLVLRNDQRYGNEGKSIPPGTPIATITFDPTCPPNLANVQYIASGIASGMLMRAEAKVVEVDLNAPVIKPVREKDVPAEVIDE